MSAKVLNVLEAINIKVAEAMVGGQDVLRSYEDANISVSPQEYILSSVYSNEDIQNRAMRYIYEMDQKRGGK